MKSQFLKKLLHGDTCHILPTSARILHAASPPSSSPLSTLTDLIVYVRKKQKQSPLRSECGCTGRWTRLKPKTTAWKAVMMDKRNVCVCVCIQYTSYLVNGFCNDALFYLNGQAYHFFLSIFVASFSSEFKASQTNMYSVQTAVGKTISLLFFPSFFFNAVLKRVFVVFVCWSGRALRVVACDFHK